MEGVLMFEHTEGDMDEFAHDGADDAHFGFAGGAKPGSEVAQWHVISDGYQSRHVEGLAQVAVALFAQASVDAPRCHLVRVVEPDRHERQPAERARLEQDAAFRPKG